MAPQAESLVRLGLLVAKHFGAPALCSFVWRSDALSGRRCS